MSPHYVTCTPLFPLASLSHHPSLTNIRIIRVHSRYAGLGLEFQKAQNQCMKFIFTLIDPVDPSR
jgi:hypothetical protein